MSVAPDWLLGILFGIGGMGGMYLGARCQKFISARAIKRMLAGIIIFTAVKYVTEYFAPDFSIFLLFKEIFTTFKEVLFN
ncbi:MAG: hypothetical protein R6U27_13760 [Desulfobacterales bacterium]